MFYLRTICPHYIHSIVSVAVMYVYEVELDEDCLGGGNGASFRASANKVSICFSFSATYEMDKRVTSLILVFLETFVPMYF
jgi:cysteine sulfinate desulfinase/cysteine desulfurase-like protein